MNQILINIWINKWIKWISKFQYTSGKGILFCTKKNKLQTYATTRMNLNTINLSGRNKMPSTERFYLYEILEQMKLQWQKACWRLPRGWLQRHEETFWRMKMFYVIIMVTVTWLYTIWHDLSKCTPKNHRILFYLSYT